MNPRKTAGSVQEPSTIGSIEEMVELVDLREIRYYEISAVRNDSEEAPERDDEIAPTYGLKVRHSEDGFGVRLRLDIVLGTGEIHVEAAAVYGLSFEEYKVSAELGLEFANRVGIMALIPFMREALSAISLKIFGDSILMPIMRQGDLQFTQEERLQHNPE